MCGRFYLKFFPDAEDIFQKIFNIPLPRPVYPPIIDDDVLPFRDITTIYCNSSDEIVSRPMYWNLIPKTSKEFEAKGTWFNTRREKLEGPYQNTLLRFKRCIIPINGFFENKQQHGKPVYHSRKVDGRSVRKKERYDFTHTEQPLMVLGGIYDVWRKREFIQYSCSIITLNPNSLIGEIHNRMPLILPNTLAQTWLDRTIDDADYLLELVQPYPSELITRQQVWPPPEDASYTDAGQLRLL